MGRRRLGPRSEAVPSPAARPHGGRALSRLGRCQGADVRWDREVGLRSYMGYWLGTRGRQATRPTPVAGILARSPGRIHPRQAGRADKRWFGSRRRRTRLRRNRLAGGSGRYPVGCGRPGGPQQWRARRFGWHNSNTRHSTRRLVSYHNLKAGIFHGTYSNPYLFEDCISHGNGTGVEWHANAHNGSDIPQEWIRLLCDGNWVSHKHSAVGDQHTVYRDCLFLGGVRFVDKGGLKPAHRPSSTAATKDAPAKEGSGSGGSSPG